MLLRQTWQTQVPSTPTNWSNSEHHMLENVKSSRLAPRAQLLQTSLCSFLGQHVVCLPQLAHPHRFSPCDTAFLTCSRLCSRWQRTQWAPACIHNTRKRTACQEKALSRSCMQFQSCSEVYLLYACLRLQHLYMSNPYMRDKHVLW